MKPNTATEINNIAPPTDSTIVEVLELRYDESSSFRAALTKFPVDTLQLLMLWYCFSESSTTHQGFHGLDCLSDGPLPSLMNLLNSRFYELVC